MTSQIWFYDIRDLYYKTLQTSNVLHMDKFCSKVESFILSATNTLALTNTPAYYEICKLHTRKFLLYRPRKEKKDEW